MFSFWMIGIRDMKQFICEILIQTVILQYENQEGAGILDKQLKPRCQGF